MVARGLIRPLKGIRGYYLLNDSLMRLGLRPVTELPARRSRSRGDMLRWAFWMVDPLHFPCPRWVMEAHRDPDHEWIVALLAQIHGPHLTALVGAEEKLAYAEDALRVAEPGSYRTAGS